MQYKSLKYFKTVEQYQKYLQNGGEILDSVNIGGIDFTMDEYDHDGRYITYGNKRTAKALEVDTHNRYKFGFDDAQVFMFEAVGFRNDINYLD